VVSATSGRHPEPPRALHRSQGDGARNLVEHVVRYIGQTPGAPIAGEILSTYASVPTSGGYSFSLRSHAAFQNCFYLAAGMFIVPGITAAFDRAVIGRNVPSPLPESVLPTAEGAGGAK